MNTNQSALTVVQEVFRCFAEHDVPGLMAVLDESIEWHEPDVDVPWRGIHHGHDGFVRWLDIIGRELSDLAVQPHEFIAMTAWFRGATCTAKAAPGNGGRRQWK